MPQHDFSEIVGYLWLRVEGELPAETTAKYPVVKDVDGVLYALYVQENYIDDGVRTCINRPCRKDEMLVTKAEAFD